jgi:SAM-dependent methyltransferase
VIKVGKPISKTLLSRTFDWKRKVHSQNRIHATRMLEKDNHHEVTCCLLCDSQTSPYIEVDGVDYGHCSNCNHVQSSIRPTLNFLTNLYGSDQEDYSSQDLAYVNLSPTDLDARVKEIARPKVEWIKNSINFHPGDLWLDIGSGTGDTLVAARQFGFDVLGIETSPSEISLAESRSVPTLAMFYDGSQRIAEIMNARVISIFNVLEHTLNPFDFLLSITQDMASGSYIVIEVPRLNGFTSVVQCSQPKNVYRHIFSPEHLNIFSDKSMDFCLNRLLLEREATWYFGSDAIEIFGHVISSFKPDFSEGLDSYSKEINLLQEQIDKNGLSDVMLLIAKKK